MAGDVWSWKLWVSRRKDGSFTVGARQTTVGEPGFSPPSLTRLRDGYSVLQALRSIMSEWHGELTDDQLQRIGIELRSLDLELAEDFEFAIEHEEEIEEGQLSLEANRRTRKLTPFRHQIDRYAENVEDYRSAPYGISRRAMVKLYMENFVVEHGRLPSGLHRINVRTAGLSYSGGERDFTDLGGEDGS